MSRLDVEGKFDQPPSDRLDRFVTRAFQAVAVALAVCLVLGLFLPDDMSAAYLVGFLFWVGIATGCLGLLMLHHLVGGQWALPIRRPLEAGGMTVFPLALLFLPIALSLGHLYPWAGSSGPAIPPSNIKRSTSTRSSSLAVRFSISQFGVYLPGCCAAGHWRRMRPPMFGRVAAFEYSVDLVWLSFFSRAHLQRSTGGCPWSPDGPQRFTAPCSLQATCLRRWR